MRYPNINDKICTNLLVYFRVEIFVTFSVNNDGNISIINANWLSLRHRTDKQEESIWNNTTNSIIPNLTGMDSIPKMAVFSWNLSGNVNGISIIDFHHFSRIACLQMLPQ